MDDALEEVHEELLLWAEGLGVEMHGIRPMRLPGRGFGSKLPFNASSWVRDSMASLQPSSSVGAGFGRQALWILLSLLLY